MITDCYVGLLRGGLSSGASEGLLRGLSRVGVGAGEGLLCGLSSVGVGAPVVFSSGENEGLLPDSYVGELVLSSTGTARGSEVLYSTVGSAVGIGVGSRLTPDGVGLIDTKSVFVG